jgi:hypothetical protein
MDESQTFRVERDHVSTGYNRVEGNRRASRNGRVSSSPTRNPTRYDSQNFSSLYATTLALLVHVPRHHMLHPSLGGLVGSHPYPQNCTTLSLIPTVNSNTVRSFYYARTTVRSPRKLNHGLTLCHHPINLTF